MRVCIKCTGPQSYTFSVLTLIVVNPCRDHDHSLQVNGKTLSGVIHKEAVEAFISAGDKVVLQVLQGAEKKIRVRNHVNDFFQDVLHLHDVIESLGFNLSLLWLQCGAVYQYQFCWFVFV